MNKVLTVIGSIFTCYGVILSLYSNFNLGVVLTLILGLFILFIGIYCKKIKALSKNRVFRMIKISIVVLLCLEFILVAFIAIYGLNDNVTCNEDAVVVLGAGVRGERVTLPLKLRLDKAVEFYEKNNDAIIVVTGGKGFQETVTEAYAMEKYLLQEGIPKGKIIKEEKATSTMENMFFSKKILDEHFKKDYKIAIVTNHFHIFRGVHIAKKAGFTDATHMHADLQWYNLIPCFLRESLAVIKTLILD